MWVKQFELNKINAHHQRTTKINPPYPCEYNEHTNSRMTFNLVSACPPQWKWETSTQVTLRPHLNCGGERIKTKLVRNQTSVTTQNSEELNLLQTGSIRVQLYLSSFPNNVNVESDLHALTKQLWTLCSFIRKAAQVNQQLRAPWKPWHLMRWEMPSSFPHLSAPDKGVRTGKPY